MKTTRHTRSTLTAALAACLALAAGGVAANDQDKPVEHDAQERVSDTADAHKDHQDRTAQTNTERLDQADSDQPIDDTWITTKVKASLLADEDVAGSEIRVVTNNGVVALSGNVDRQTEVDQAKEIARGIEGVVEVDASDLNVGTMANYDAGDYEADAELDANVDVDADAELDADDEQ